MSKNVVPTPDAGESMQNNLDNLLKEFAEAVKLEFDGLKRFEEIERELVNLQSGTPEYRTIRSERIEMIKQVRGSRKVQKELKLEIYHS